MNNFILILIPILFLACRKVDIPENKPLIFGHGGMGIKSLDPINSFPSLTKALEKGVNGIEIDVQLSKDSVLVAFHDPYLENSLNQPGSIIEYDYSEIKQFTYNKTPFNNPTVISIDSLFQTISNPNEFIYSFDCKLRNDSMDRSIYLNRFINAINRLIAKYQLQNIYIESSDTLFLSAFENSNIEIYQYVNSLEKAETSNYNISISTRNISKEEIETLQQSNKKVMIWNIYSKSDNIDAINKGADIIQSDKLDHITRILD